MTDNKKEQERNELHRTIWAIADEMRGYFEVDGEDEGSEGKQKKMDALGREHPS